jgi:hypothetical protein
VVLLRLCVDGDMRHRKLAEAIYKLASEIRAGFGAERDEQG